MSILVDKSMVAKQDEQTSNSRIALPDGFSYLSDFALEVIRIKHNLQNIGEILEYLGFREIEDNIENLNNLPF